MANFDAPEQAIADLRAGAVDLVIAQKPADMGTTGIDYAMMAISGDTSSVQKRVPTGYVVIDRNTQDFVEVVKEEGRQATEVLDEVRPGYRWRDRLFRPAQVRVARPPLSE